MAAGHIPVLAAEVVAQLAPRDRGIYVDGTLGACGYAEAILATADCRVYGIDRDPQAIENAKEKAKSWGRTTDPAQGLLRRYGGPAEGRGGDRGRRRRPRPRGLFHADSTTRIADSLSCATVPWTCAWARRD